MRRSLLGTLIVLGGLAASATLPGAGRGAAAQAGHPPPPAAPAQADGDDEGISVEAAAKLPSGFTDSELTSALPTATAMEFAPDGRLFVSTQQGDLRIVKDGALLGTPFVHVAVDASGERGLLGVAFDPDFANNHYLYVVYVQPAPEPHLRVSRFTADGDVAVPGSEAILFETDPIGAGLVHNAGSIHFGKDGKLYIAVGDVDKADNAQDLATQFGKILRINADGSIPADNPFYASASGNNRAIWAYGLRNPLISAPQPVTGQLFVNDSGKDAWEEIDVGQPGANYGWPLVEGPTTDPKLASPIFAYAHGTSATTGCAITGGVFYNPPQRQFPATYVGLYFFADLCGGWIRTLDPSSGNAVAAFATNVARPVDLDVGPGGALYYLTSSGGNSSVHKIQYSQAPAIGVQPVDRTVSAGQIATFSVGANGAEPLAYQWQRDGVNIPGATSFNYVVAAATLADSGATFRCVVSSPHGSVTSASATLTVTADPPPSGVITQPAAGTLYKGGDTITFAGTGSDTNGAPLPPSALTWEVVFHHDQHTHPVKLPFTGVLSGTFSIPRGGETSTNVWYRVYLTVRNAAGLSYTSYRDIGPRTSTITIKTIPAGLPIVLDGQAVATPYSRPSVVGVLRTLEAAPAQTVAGATLPFAYWSDGGKMKHRITTAGPNRTYTAVYLGTQKLWVPLAQVR
jgi:glucose/arabinose dehydrogenase